MNIAKISSKGQVTIPAKVRQRLKSDIVEFEIREDEVLLKPVPSVSGALKKYAKKYIPLEEIRDKVWETVAHDKTQNLPG